DVRVQRTEHTGGATQPDRILFSVGGHVGGGVDAFLDRLVDAVSGSVEGVRHLGERMAGHRSPSRQVRIVGSAATIPASQNTPIRRVTWSWNAQVSGFTPPPPCALRRSPQ